MVNGHPGRRWKQTYAIATRVSVYGDSAWWMMDNDSHATTKSQDQLENTFSSRIWCTHPSMD